MDQSEDIFGIRESDVIMPAARARSDSWRLLRRLALPNSFLAPTPDMRVVQGLVVDTETTGLAIGRDEVIQLALVPFSYDRNSGKVISADPDQAYVGLREPTVPVGEASQAIHGIDPDTLRGQAIDDARVRELAEAASLVVAHNADFDRPMVERHWPAFAGCNWACSARGVDWPAAGAHSSSLESLAARYGFFFDPHDALEDARAVLALLTRRLPDERTVLAAVRESALGTDWLVRVADAPYDANEALREHGYRWRPAALPGGRVWWKITDDPEPERDWLRATVYSGEDRAGITRITAATRHSARIWNG